MFDWDRALARSCRALPGEPRLFSTGERIVAMNRLALLALLLAGADTARAQRPDFSGEWVRAEPASQPSVASTGNAAFRAGDFGPGWGSPLTIVQRTDSVIVEYVFFGSYDLQPPLRFAYAVDGSESRNSVMIGHATAVQRSRLSWNGNALVIATAHPVPAGVDPRGGSVEVRQTLTLESPTSLVVETTRAGVRGAAATMTRTVYTKR
jgi:hypothetical protein